MFKQMSKTEAAPHSFRAGLAALCLIAGTWGTASGGPHVCNRPPDNQLPSSVSEALSRIDVGAEGGRDAYAPLTVRMAENRKAVELGEMSDGEAALLGGTLWSGTRDIPVFPFLFANSSGTPFSRASLDAQLFGSWATGSLKDYYDEISYGNFTVGGDVYSWYTVSEDDDYYAGGSYGLNPANSELGEGLHEILAAKDGAIDFGRFDNDGPDGIPNSGDDDGYVDFCAFVTPDKGAACAATICPWTSAGGGIWPHQWYLSQWPEGVFTTNDARTGGGTIRINRYLVSAGVGCSGGQNGIGTFAHEYGHVLGLADYYDRADWNGESEGIGHWGLMGSGGWNTIDHPAHMTAYAKNYLGWLSYFQVTHDLPSLCFPPVELEPFAARLWTHGAQGAQYFLVENRQAIGFDQDLHGPGLVIYHVNGAYSTNNDETRKKLDVECADAVSAAHAANADDLDKGRCYGGNRGDAGDPWCFANQATFDDSSVPNSRAYDGSSTQVAVRNIGICQGDAGGYVCAEVEVGQAVEADLCMRDCLAYGCAEVSACNKWWATPDLWIDNDNDGDDDIPSEDVTNVVWYRVENAGPTAVAGASVEIFYRQAGLGLRWPDAGTLIKQETIDDTLDPGESYIDSVLFVYPDPPDQHEHYCLGAVVSHDLDPQNSVYPPHDNNVVQVNHQVLVDRGTAGAAPSGPSGMLTTSCGSLSRRTILEIYAGETEYGDTLELRVGSPPNFDDWDYPAGWNLNFNAGPYVLTPGSMDSVSVRMIAADAAHGDTAHVPLTLWDVAGAQPAGGVVLDFRVDCVAPAAPQNMNGECVPYEIDQISGPSVLIEWDPVTFDAEGGAEQIKHYEVYRSDSQGTPETLVEKVAVDADWNRSGFQWYDYVPKSDILYTYRVRAVDAADAVSDFSASVTIDFVLCATLTGTGPESVRPLGASGVSLEAGPNPFTASTTIAYELPAAEQVTLRIYDVRGRTVKTLVDRAVGAGAHRMDWNGRADSGTAVTPGIYFAHLQVGSQTQTQKLVRINRQ